jgi:hypothetical protein
MIQTVKIIIKWHDDDDCVLGAVKEVEIDLPKWGKRSFMRNEISRMITSLIWDAHNTPKQPTRFKDYAYSAFSPDRIIQIKARTKGSFINLKDESLMQFIADNNIH